MATSTQPAPRVAEPSRRGPTQALRRLGWGVADQGMSSLSNFALGLFVARSYGASDFGAFSLAFVTYAFVLNAARGLSTDPLLVRFTGTEPAAWRRAASSATGTAFTVGTVSGVLCVLAGLLLPGQVGVGFVVLGVFLPGLALQDSWRFAFFAAGRGLSAFLNDLAWAVLLVAGLLVLHLSGRGNPTTCLLVFGATATVCAGMGAVQARVLPRPARLRSWLLDHRALSFRYLIENVSVSGASQVRSYVLGGVVSLAAVGYVRASEIVMGPFLVVLMGISQVAVPEASRALARGTTPLRRFCLGLGAVQATAAIAWGLVLLLVFPHGLGAALLDEIWRPTLALLPAITCTVVAASFITAANAGLRALGMARRSLRAQLTTSVLYALGGAGGAVLGGAVGTSWGVTAAQVLGATMCWYQLRSGLAERSRATVPA